MAEIPLWLRRRLQSAKRTGKLVAAGEPEFSMKSMSNTANIAILNLINYMDLSYTSATSLVGLPPLPKIRTFKADHTKINTLVNISSIKNSITLSFKDTPISKSKNFKLALLLAVGTNITSINGTIVSVVLRERASSYPSSSAALVDKGWAVIFPPPDEASFKVACEQLGVSEPEMPLPKPKAKDHAEEPEGFDSMSKNLLAQHEAMIQENLEYFGVKDETAALPASDFRGQLLGLFSRFGRSVGGSDNDILDFVQSLCDGRARA